MLAAGKRAAAAHAAAAAPCDVLDSGCSRGARQLQMMMPSPSPSPVAPAPALSSLVSGLSDLCSGEDPCAAFLDNVTACLVDFSSYCPSSCRDLLDTLSSNQSASSCLESTGDAASARYLLATAAEQCRAADECGLGVEAMLTPVEQCLNISSDGDGGCPAPCWHALEMMDNLTACDAMMGSAMPDVGRSEPRTQPERAAQLPRPVCWASVLARPADACACRPRSR